MYAVKPISEREVVDLGSDSEEVDLGSDSEHMDLGSESDTSDAERSQMHLPPNMKTNGTKYMYNIFNCFQFNVIKFFVLENLTCRF